MNFSAKRANWCLYYPSSSNEVTSEFFLNKLSRSTLLDPELIFWAVSDRFDTERTSVQNGLIGSFNANFVQQSASEFFAMNAPNPPHWIPNSCFGAFWTVSLLHELRRKKGRTGAINAQVRATKSCWNFLHRTQLIHHIGPQNHVLGRF
jgi:hypothetical protein